MKLFEHRRSPESMRRFYNWFARHYGRMDGALTATIDDAVAAHVAPLPGIAAKTALEYACGTGNLSLRLAAYFRTVSSRDASSGMLAKARQKAGRTIMFSEGDLNAIDEKDASYDWVFISFALHLFSSVDEERILRRLFAIARDGVIIIDHRRKWEPLAAFVEWIEGSYYDHFIRMDFKRIAEEMGASFVEDDRAKCSVMTFRH